MIGERPGVTDRARRTGPRELSVAVTPRYRVMWTLVRVLVRGLFDVRAIGLEPKAHLRPAGLTQIEMRKLELARAMAARPKLLISDEAMAGLSHAEVDDILAILFDLNARGITIIMIEHIMRAVMRFSERIVVLDAGERIAEGTPEEIIRNAAVEKAYLGE